MPQAQSGICAQANLHGLHLFFNVLDGHDESVRDKLAELAEIQNEFDERFSEAMVASMVAIGAQYWPHLYPEAIPPQLKSFPVFEQGEHSMLSQPFDIFVQIRSDREDVNHLFGLQVIKLFGADVELVEHIKGFRFLDGRDFNGFIYGSDSPQGRQKKRTALVDDPGSVFDQGSYLHVQRYCHNLSAWQQLSVHEQEQIMGRSRLDNELLMPLDANSHAVRSELKDETGQPLVLHQGMPFGDVYKQGMLAITCSAHGDAFERILQSRLGQGDDYDHWLDFSLADMGSAYFAPSVDFFRQQRLNK